MARSKAAIIRKLNRQIAKLDQQEEIRKLRKKVSDKRDALAKKG